MKRSVVSWIGLLAVTIAMVGCGGGVEEGLPKGATYKPPMEMPSMKPTSSKDIAKAKAEAAAAAPK